MPLPFLQGIVSSVDFEPQRQKHAVIYIAGLEGGTTLLPLAVQSFGLPKVDVNPTELFFLNRKVSYAGSASYQDVQVTFNDFVNKDVAGIIWRWMRQVYDARGNTIGLKSEYAKEGWIDMAAPNGSFERRYDLHSVWPMNTDPGDIDHSSDDGVRIQLTLRIDWMEPTFAWGESQLVGGFVSGAAVSP